MWCSHGIDLHIAAIHRNNLPQIRANLDDFSDRHPGEHSGVPVLLNSTPGRLTEEAAAEFGIPMLLHEAGEGCASMRLLSGRDPPWNYQCNAGDGDAAGGKTAQKRPYGALRSPLPALRVSIQKRPLQKGGISLAAELKRGCYRIDRQPVQRT